MAQAVSKPKIGFIGIGKVGTTLARLLFARGYTITAVFNRTHTSAETLANMVSASVASEPAEVVIESELIFLTVSDDALEMVAGQLINSEFTNKAFVHTSGALTSTILAKLENLGAMVGSIHPVFPFADIESSVRDLPGATFGIETTSPKLQAWLKTIVENLDGQIIQLDQTSKILYHAAMVIASNYLVSLYSIAQEILLSIGANERATSKTLNYLVQSTVENISDIGIPDALTGPLTRQDIGTIQAHIQALKHYNLEVEQVYRMLAHLSLPMLEKRGIDTSYLTGLLESG